MQIRRTAGAKIATATFALDLQRHQEPITWRLHLPYKPLESTLSDEKLFIEIAFAEYFSRLLSNIQSEQSYDHTSHADSQKRDGGSQRGRVI